MGCKQTKVKPFKEQKKRWRWRKDSFSSEEEIRAEKALDVEFERRCKYSASGRSTRSSYSVMSGDSDGLPSRGPTPFASVSSTTFTIEDRDDMKGLPPAFATSCNLRPAKLAPIKRARPSAARGKRPPHRPYDYLVYGKPEEKEETPGPSDEYRRPPPTPEVDENEFIDLALETIFLPNEPKRQVDEVATEPERESCPVTPAVRPTPSPRRVRPGAAKGSRTVMLFEMRSEATTITSPLKIHSKAAEDIVVVDVEEFDEEDGFSDC